MAKLVLVAGATGGVGKQVVLNLLAEEIPVRVLVRDFISARRDLSDEVEYIAGDVREASTLTPALDKVNAVICAIGAHAEQDPTNTPEAVDYEGVRNLVEAAKAADVDHFVLISWLGVTQPENGNNGMRDVLSWKAKGEDAVRESGLSYTIIRPGTFTDDPGGYQMLQVSQGDKPEFTGSVSREDVASLAVKALDNPAARKVTFEVVGKDGTPSSDWYRLYGGLKPDR